MLEINGLYKWGSKCLIVLNALLILSGTVFTKEVPPLNPLAPDRLPTKVDGKSITPELGCFWSFDLSGDDYKNAVDLVAPYGAFDAMLLTNRSKNSIVGNRQEHKMTKKAVEYALNKYGIKTLVDLDVRIARYDFEKEHPDLAQERLFFKEANIDGENIAFEFVCNDLNDHYTGNLPYFVRGGRVVKAWAYDKNEKGEIVSESIVDVTDFASWDKNQYFVEDKRGLDVDSTSRNSLKIDFKNSSLLQKRAFITCAVAFRYAYPDIFADEILELERKIYKSYSDVPLWGACKDEWGFPPCFNRDDNLDDFWYSERMRVAYANKYDKKDLLDDLFLAFRPRQGYDDERIFAVDRFHRLCGDRVVIFEKQNYELNKKFWGKDAFVGVHTTWYPWPNTLEMRKNSIMWWKAPRDIAQTDEYVPFCVRNSMAKATDSHWINMFYAGQTSLYIWEHWTSAASGGRVHIHQIYPRDENSPKNDLDNKWLPLIADGDVAKIRQKVRMLSLISDSPIDSPVAVLFGRFAASNPLRPEYKAIGWDICDRFATRGYIADLIPIDEFSSSNQDGKSRWTFDDGFLKYGKQKYQVIILYGCESSAEKQDYEALCTLAKKSDDCRTRIVSLSVDASDEDRNILVEKTIDFLKKQKVVLQTPWKKSDYQFEPGDEVSARPTRKSMSRYLDGTIVWIAAQDNDLGDPIILENETVLLNDGVSTRRVSVKANGVFAIRFDEKGELNALVATELRFLNVGNFNVNFTDEVIGDDPIDVAIWKSGNGEWRGVIQRSRNELPEELQKKVKNWMYLQRR